MDKSNANRSIEDIFSGILSEFKQKYELQPAEKDSKINNTSMPSTSGVTKMQLNKRNRNAKKNGSRKKNKRTVIPNNSSNDEDDDDEDDNGGGDPDYKPNSNKYEKMSNREIHNMATRIQVYHETGVVIPSENETLNPCKNKYKKSNDKPVVKVAKSQLPQIPGTRFGDGRVGVGSTQYGVQKCTCCNSSNHHDYSRILDNMPEEVAQKIKERENRLYMLELKDLYNHPELKGTKLLPDNSPTNTSKKKEVLQLLQHNSASVNNHPLLSEEKYQRIQNFVDTVRLSTSPNCTEEERLLLNSGQQLVAESSQKTIQERIDFSKKFRRRSKSLVLTSTPYSITKPSTSRSENNFDMTQKLSAIKPDTLSTIPPTKQIKIRLNMNEEEKPSCTDISKLDRSFVTLRTPNKKQQENMAPPNTVENTENDIMNYIDNLLAEEKEEIIQEVEERHKRLIQSHEEIQNALDDLIVLDDDEYSNVLDDSVIIIENSENPNNNRKNNFQVSNPTNFIQISEDELSDIEVINTPSTSIRRGRKRKVTRKKNAQASKRSNEKQKSNVSITETLTPIQQGNIQKAPARALHDCPICLEPFANREISSTICGHVFCTNCIVSAVRAKRVCPNCRTALTMKKIHPLFI